MEKNNGEQKKELSQEEKICMKMDAIGRKILIMSGKGGVGKTTVTVNLANALAALGHTVGVLDTDIHGPNIAKMFGLEGRFLEEDPETCEIIPVTTDNGIRLVSLSFALPDPSQAVVFRGPMKLSAIKQFLADVRWGSLDYLLIDSPPGTGDEQLAVCQNIPALTGAIVVTTPQKVAILDSAKSISFARDVSVPVIGLVENMSYLICPHCGEKQYIFGRDGGKKLCIETGIPLLGSIPMETGLEEAEDNGENWLSKGDSESSAVFREIAAYIHSAIKPTSSKDIGYVPKGAGCSPSACSSCTSDCPSRKNG